MEKTCLVNLVVEVSGEVLSEIKSNEVTLLCENEDEDDEVEHLKVGAMVHFTPEDDISVNARPLKAKITKVWTKYELKKITNKKRVVKPQYELTVRPNRAIPKKH